MKLFKKPKSKFYWYDFAVRGRRYRASTQETRSVKALKIASLKLASIIENTDPLPSKPTALGDFAERFLDWVDTARLEEMTRKSYRNGWRLLKATPVADTRLNQITGDCADQLKFPGSAANANCALRTLRRMLHKAQEWKIISHAPKIKMMKEHGRHLRLDDEAERKLLEGAQACTWRRRTFELFRDVVIHRFLASPSVLYRRGQTVTHQSGSVQKSRPAVGAKTTDPLQIHEHRARGEQITLPCLYYVPLVLVLEYDPMTHESFDVQIFGS